MPNLIFYKGRKIMKALLIEFDLRTGIRAGNVSPRDPNLPCRGWQDLESVPAREIRVIKDGRDVKQYQNVLGITILSGKIEINAAIDSLNLERYTIKEPELFRLHMEQKNINLDDYVGWEEKAIKKDLFEKKKILGIRKHTPRKLTSEDELNVSKV